MQWKRHEIFYVSVFICFLSTLIKVEARTDFQIWNDNFLYGSLNKRVDLSLSTAFRYKNSGSTFYYNHEHVELPISVSSFFTIGPAYRQIFHLVSNRRNQWTTAYYPNINFTFLWHIGAFQFYDRSRFAYVIQPGVRASALQYRNKLGIYRKISDNLYGVRFFADEEIFLEQRRRGIYENRASVGFDLGLFKKIRISLAYRNRIIRTNDGWDHDNILMINPYANF